VELQRGNFLGDSDDLVGLLDGSEGRRKRIRSRLEEFRSHLIVVDVSPYTTEDFTAYQSFTLASRNIKRGSPLEMVLESFRLVDWVGYMPLLIWRSSNYRVDRYPGDYLFLTTPGTK
jgi:hypothetical protein